MAAAKEVAVKYGPVKQRKCSEIGSSAAWESAACSSEEWASAVWPGKHRAVIYDAAARNGEASKACRIKVRASDL